MKTSISQELINNIIKIAKEAGMAIMKTYQQDFEVYQKDNQSPITLADLKAHQIIMARLALLPEKYPVLSEESSFINWETRNSWQTYWLVDPLDGTKEFINKNDEFTVNIALIHEGEPVLGVVYIPATKITYWAGQGLGAFKEENGTTVAISASPIPKDAAVVQVLASRSHPSADLPEYLKRFKNHVITEVGSSIKLCLIAEGKAHIYPKLGPTYEWDLGAAHAVMLEAGAEIKNLAGEPLRYNLKNSLINPPFVAQAK